MYIVEISADEMNVNELSVHVMPEDEMTLCDVWG
jgi:hypothetical protein